MMNVTLPLTLKLARTSATYPTDPNRLSHLHRQPCTRRDHALHLSKLEHYPFLPRSVEQLKKLHHAYHGIALIYEWREYDR